MSLKKIALASAAVFLVARPAAAGETSVTLLGGYASEIRRAERPGDTSYGWGLGTRLEHRFDIGLYLGGGFIMHAGSSVRAEDATGASTYRTDRHAAYLGPEVGWELGTRLLVVRPYLGAGGWYVFDRIVVRNREIEGNGVSPYVLPGLFLGYRSDTWKGGLDFRMPIATRLAISEAAPAVFLTFGFVLSRSPAVRQLQPREAWSPNRD